MWKYQTRHEFSVTSALDVARPHSDRIVRNFERRATQCRGTQQWISSMDLFGRWWISTRVMVSFNLQNTFVDYDTCITKVMRACVVIIVNCTNIYAEIPRTSIFHTSSLDRSRKARTQNFIRFLYFYIAIDFYKYKNIFRETSGLSRTARSLCVCAR